ncbi:MAG: HypC/HybG/HupF family hydrogenase formation chaperone [Gammaproteobacteria bacterium]|nr:HypC/HybG/HupF family hydrogenase formation chaperone [Gammaproteobacteria bacterium]MCP4876289.1 HypC/HybG/HupF family hydrogenase formation chaperone [Gammaproteobacteria bacterium]
MCIGVPVQIIESGDLMALCHGRNGEERVNMMLIGAQPEGSWVLNFLGSAREVLSEQDALDINKALDGLHAIMAGETDVDIDSYFPGLG